MSCDLLAGPRDRAPAEGERTPACAGPAPRVLVIADSDPRLDAACAGWAGGGAQVIRRPGPTVAPSSQYDAELSAALTRGGLVEVVVCGHAPAPTAGGRWWDDDCPESGVGFWLRRRAREAEDQRRSGRHRAALAAQAANLWTYSLVLCQASLGRLRVSVWSLTADGKVVLEVPPAGQDPISHADGD